MLNQNVWTKSRFKVLENSENDRVSFLCKLCCCFFTALWDDWFRIYLRAAPVPAGCREFRNGVKNRRKSGTRHDGAPPPPLCLFSPTLGFFFGFLCCPVQHPEFPPAFFPSPRSSWGGPGLPLIGSAQMAAPQPAGISPRTSLPPPPPFL